MDPTYHYYDTGYNRGKGLSYVVMSLNGSVMLTCYTGIGMGGGGIYPLLPHKLHVQFTWFVLLDRGENGECFCHCQLEKVLILSELNKACLTSTFSKRKEYKHSWVIT